ncbi:hypothetical protein BDV26DRAFT_253075 [Aspergillus bertholletiae]|uniref:Uncharacterized protein n=1 Tax=Aspergillus bertholletiae TaxID=1226010 RepID=A0A5N7BLW8_9EURO|nr:hypothetical protein BDV26DRAFT_253075 [Aspergillus bertholletiae]
MHLRSHLLHHFHGKYLVTSSSFELHFNLVKHRNWTHYDFRVIATTTMERLRRATASTISFGQTVSRDHPKALAAGSAGLALAMVPITGPLVLGAVGFSATGPVAASLAAAWQSSIGCVQAGSLFATLQGAAMGGAAAGTFTTASNIGLGIMGSAAVGAKLAGKKSGNPAEDNDGGSSEGIYDDDRYPDECTATDLQTSDTNGRLRTEFAKLSRIDMS